MSVAPLVVVMLRALVSVVARIHYGTATFRHAFFPVTHKFKYDGRRAFRLLRSPHNLPRAECFEGYERRAGRAGLVAHRRPQVSSRVRRRDGLRHRLSRSAPSGL